VVTGLAATFTRTDDRTLCPSRSSEPAGVCSFPATFTCTRQSASRANMANVSTGQAGFRAHTARTTLSSCSARPASSSASRLSPAVSKAASRLRPARSVSMFTWCPAVRYRHLSDPTIPVSAGCCPTLLVVCWYDAGLMDPVHAFFDVSPDAPVFDDAVPARFTPGVYTAWFDIHTTPARLAVLSQGLFSQGVLPPDLPRPGWVSRAGGLVVQVRSRLGRLWPW
jgi:hypothetical protein